MFWNFLFIDRPRCVIFSVAMQCVKGSKTPFCEEADRAVPISVLDNVINPRTYLWATQNGTNRVIYCACWNVTPLACHTSAVCLIVLFPMGDCSPWYRMWMPYSRQEENVRRINHLLNNDRKNALVDTRTEGRDYEVRRWDGPRCHDVHKKFRKGWPCSPKSTTSLEVLGTKECYWTLFDMLHHKFLLSADFTDTVCK
jgi:hypothetical protein